VTTQILPVPLVHQRDTPYCSYACVSMVLRYFGINKSVSQVASEVTIPQVFYDIDEDFAPAPVGMPQLYQSYAVIREYLQDQGLDARILHNQDLNAIKANIKRGNPLIVSVVMEESPHSWVVRGYIDDTGNKSIIYNDPQDEPSGDPVSYDPSVPPDGNPGRTMKYDAFVKDHWHDELPMADRMMLAISVKGMGIGSDTTFDWRGSGARTFQAFLYHASKFIDKAMRGELFGASIEGTLTLVGLPAAGVSFVQQAGQSIANYGEELIEKGGLFTPIGIFIKAVGGAIDVAAGTTGLGFEWVMDFIDGIGAMLDGQTSGGTSMNINDIHVYLVAVLSVRPWKTRWGKNWEKISGGWGILVPSGDNIDIDVKWKVSVWGWGVDQWSLSRRINYNVGTLIRNSTGTCTNYVKRFETEVDDINQFWMGFGENKCRYGKDGGLTRVQVKVEAWATTGGETKKFTITKSIYGLST